MTARIQTAALSKRVRHFARRQGLHLVTTVAGVRRLVLWLLVVVTSFDACAQTASTGALTGTVTDPSGALVQHATITVRNYGTGGTLTAISGQDGSYRFSLLPAGEYELTVEAVNFTPAVVRQVLIQITEVRSIATQLVVAGTREEVLVKASRLQADNATLGSVIDRGTIVTLPLVNRNYTQILGLTAGTNTNVVDAIQLIRLHCGREIPGNGETLLNAKAGSHARELRAIHPRVDH